jgi:hypothetical protein
VAQRGRLHKDTDYETRFRCAAGFGLLREEVWIDENNTVIRYNLALILPHLYRKDNGRVLGYDNAHGIHERHYMGDVTPFSFQNYLATARRFYREAEALRGQDENQGLS